MNALKQDTKGPLLAEHGPALQLHVASLFWTIITGVIFYHLGQEDLILAPYTFLLMGFLASSAIYKRRIYSIVKQVLMFVLVGAATAVCMFFELEARSVAQPLPAQAQTVIADAFSEEIVGAYAGYRRLENGGLSYVVLNIEGITSQPTAAVFRYSLMERGRVQEGQGQLFRTTKTLRLPNLPILRYERENGEIILRPLIGSSPRFTRRNPL